MTSILLNWQCCFTSDILLEVIHLLRNNVNITPSWILTIYNREMREMLIMLSAAFIVRRYKLVWKTSQFFRRINVSIIAVTTQNVSSLLKSFREYFRFFYSSCIGCYFFVVGATIRSSFHLKSFLLKAQ